jgi:hypothetical protein
MSHIKILSIRMVTCLLFYHEHPKILGTRIKAPFAMATWSPVFVHFYSNQFFHYQSFRPNYGPGYDSTSDGKENDGYVLGGKGDRCVALTNLLLSYADCLEILEVSTSWNPQSLSSDCFTVFDLKEPIRGVNLVGLPQQRTRCKFSTNIEANVTRKIRESILK